MIVHTTSFIFKADRPDGSAQALKTELRDHIAGFPGLIAYYNGDNLGLRAGAADFGVCAIFDTSENLTNYLDHPGHKDIVARWADTVIASRQSVQFDSEK
jgi:antibiotic biosynthesis monooxygenase (ABM) superfamily enzyme